MCTTRSSGAPWWNRSFPSQTGRFHVELVARPSANNLDAVVGLSRGAASQWAQLAAIVRFNSAGFVDVRAGNTYRADVAYSYSANVTYFMRLDVDVTAHTYSVWLKTSAAGPYEPIARGYPFRTEQALVPSLDNTAAYLDPSRPGSLSLCDISVVQDDVASGGCMIATAGDGFANAQLAGTTGAMIMHFTAQPSTANMDAVVGFAKGAVDAYDDLAVAVRFWTNGMIEARDGDVYRADEPVPYAAGTKYDFYLVVDIPSKTYSVFVMPRDPYGAHLELARGYKFRTQQQTITALDHTAEIVASATGRIDACAFGDVAPTRLSFARPGTYFVRPLTDGGALLSDDTRTQRLGATGKTIAEIPRGGMSAVDASGNIYIASASGGTLTLSSFTSALAPRWSRTYPANGSVVAMGVYTTGEIAVAVSTWSQPHQLIHIHPNGSEHLRHNLAQYPAMAVGIGRTDYTIAYQLGAGVAVEAHHPDGHLLWQRSWNGAFGVGQMARDPSGGVVFAGVFAETIDFGDGPLEPTEDPDHTALNTFLVALAPTGALRFSKHVYSTFPTGLSTNGSRIAIATRFQGYTPNMELWAFDGSGNQVWSYVPLISIPGSVAVGPSGRIYANLELKIYPGYTWETFPFLFAIDP
ncbi:MAG TPA: hypothetical protein VNO30_11520 [Kofleriaceae bacterium]|nr:hypothetical protein [Kofleriaceae bacterium]